jgi:hypothetical protein
MPDTSFGGLTNFTRYYYAQVGKDAVIIDERFNGGGALATDIIEHLKRTMMSLVATRDGEDEVQPQGAIFGPKVMIINEFAGSGGDAMPNYFRRAGVGRLIGKRTWGGLVGRAGAPPLMDGGFVTAPSSAVWRVGCRERGDRAGHRGRTRSRARPPGEGSPAGARDRRGDDGAEEEPRRETHPARVSELSQEEDHDERTGVAPRVQEVQEVQRFKRFTPDYFENVSGAMPVLNSHSVIVRSAAF